MRLRLFLFFVLFCPVWVIFAQESPTEIRYAVMDIQALRYYPFTTDADSIIGQTLRKKAENLPPYSQCDVYRKTSIDWIANKEALDNRIQDSENRNDLVYKCIIKPYRNWLEYSRPLKTGSKHIGLTSALYEDIFTVYSDNVTNKKGSFLQASRNLGLYKTLGEQNVAGLLDDVLKDVDLYSNRNDILFHLIDGPLNEKAVNKYQYFLSGRKNENGEALYEIVFYPNKPTDWGFAGYLYVTADGNYSLRKAVFSLNNLYKMNFKCDALFKQTFAEEGVQTVSVKKETFFTVGDDIEGCLDIHTTSLYSRFDYPESLEKDKFGKMKYDKDYQSKDNAFWDSQRPEPLTASETQIEKLIETAAHTTAFRNVKTGVHFLLTDYLAIGGENGIFEWGPITHAVSYNKMEGLRLRAGGSTTLNLNKHFLLGGYAAYGSKDERFKYRGDFTYSFSPKDKYIEEYPKSLISFTYVNDLNIPGQDILSFPRDFFLYSFSHSGVNSMSLQKMGVLAYEKELPSHFSFKIGGKYLSDTPVGLIQYNEIISSELSLRLRYAPHEKFLQNREDRMALQKGDFELNLNHRQGIKGIFSSGYNYRITDFKAYKKFYFPQEIGTFDLHFSAGKVWDKIPFPLLFIPAGNQSYVFEQDDYNLMNYHEFITDNFVSGNANILFHWSPFRLFIPSNKIKTSLGIKMLYGPMSEKNKQAFLSEYALNRKINLLEKTPYTEVNIGLANIFKYFRIEYVRRLTYLDNDESTVNKGSLFFNGSFSF